MIDMNRLLTQVMSGASGGTSQESGGQHGFGGLRPHAPGSAPMAKPPESESRLLGHAGALGTGALAGGLAGMLLGSKRMREVAGTAIQIGAVAAVGGLAYKAYRNYQQGKPIVPQSISDMLADGPQQPNDASGARNPVIETWIPPHDRSSEVGNLLLRSMVAAAAADGHLDGAEYGRIRQHLLASGLNEEEQFFLSQLIMRPNSVSELAKAAITPELRAEVYAAARLAIEPDSPQEREWLDQLAAALNLEPGLKAHLDAIDGAKQARAA